jgi:hypothetical protein
MAKRPNLPSLSTRPPQNLFSKAMSEEYFYNLEDFDGDDFTIRPSDNDLKFRAVAAAVAPSTFHHQSIAHEFTSNCALLCS